VLDAAESRRLAALLDREAPLTADEQADLAHLLEHYGQRLHERRMRELARRRGVSIEDVEREQAERRAAALRWWEAFDHDPARDEILARAAADLQSRWPA
jgi:transposase